MLLEKISRKYDRFGWDNISDEVRVMLKEDWIDALLDYPINEINEAIRDYVNDTKNKKAAHEGQIKAIVIANRQRVVASQPKTPAPEPERIQASGEFRQAEMDRVGFHGSVNIKNFHAKPEERE